MSQPIEARPSVVYVLPDKMGGLVNIIANLLAWRRPDAFSHEAVLVFNPFSSDTRFAGRLAADRQTTLQHAMPTENLHSVLRRVFRAISPGPGVLVANDWIELAMLSRHDSGKLVVQILHGDHAYYYDLALKHEAVVDVFVAYSRAMAARLRQLLPERPESVVHLPYGIPIPRRAREARPGPLRLVYAGRLEHGQKGVFELPEIDKRLRALGVDVVWTVIGDGPDAEQLRRRWQSPSVTWLGQRTNAFVLERLLEDDVFVLPTRAEGFSVALLEAMAAGLVPVVSRIESGVAEVVEEGRTGCTPEVGDVAGFASAIASLAADRGRAEALGAAARQRVSARHDVRERVGAFQDLYARYAELRRPRPAAPTLHYGNRLDRPWIPNLLVRAVRTPLRRLRLKGSR